MTLCYKEIASPVGKLKLVASANALVAVLWENEQPNRRNLIRDVVDPQQPILLEDRAPAGGIFRWRKKSSSIFRSSPRAARFRRKSGRH